MKYASTLLLFLLAFVALAATPPAPPANPSSPLLPPQQMVMLTNVAMVWTNVAVKTATIEFQAVTLYGGTNALKGATVVSWEKSPDTNVTNYLLYYGPATLAQTNKFTTQTNITTVLFYGTFSTNLTYWAYVTAAVIAGTNVMESVPSNTILFTGK